MIDHQSFIHSGNVLLAFRHCNHYLSSCNETLRYCKGGKDFEELFRYDEIAALFFQTRQLNLKPCIA